MQKQICYINTPSTQCTSRTPEKEYTTNPFQKQSDINYNNISDSKGMKLMIQKQQSDSLIPNQNISQEDQKNIYFNNQLANIHENLMLITQQCQEKSSELKVEKQKRMDIESKFAQLQQHNQLLEEDLNKQKQICKQMENVSKELENKLQIQFTNTSSNCSQQNSFNIIRQKEQEIQELKLLLEKEKDQASIKQDRLMKEFQIIFQQQKTLNQQLLEENIQLQKALRSNSSNQSQKSQSKLLDEQQLSVILENYYSTNNDECLQQIPSDQYLSAIKILKEISLSIKQQQDIHPQQQKQQEQIKNQSHLRELRDRQEQLIVEIKKQMEKFIQQKNTQQKDIINFKNEIDELKRQLDQVENIIQDMEYNPKQQPFRNSNVSFENDNFE